MPPSPSDTPPVEPDSAGAAARTGDDDAPAKPLWKRAWPFVKWTLFAILIAFVGHRAWQLWTADPDALARVELRPVWLLPAVAAYVLGWIPSVWFWQTMLERLGYTVDSPSAARAYYCGHLGKYIPGKALALLIRVWLLRPLGVAAAAAGLTAAYDTLAMMAVGMALGVALAPTVLDATIWESATGLLGTIWSWGWFRTLWTTPGAMAAVIGTITIALLPLTARLAMIAANKMVPSEFDGDPATGAEAGPESAGGTRSRGRIDTRLFAVGTLVLIAGWWMHGLSFGCVVAAVSGQPFDLSDWPAWTSAVALATSLGFAAIFAPGGAGVREWILIEVLRVQPNVTAQSAVAAAFLLRLTWLVAELVVAAGLYWGIRPKTPAAVVDGTTNSDVASRRSA